MENTSFDSEHCVYCSEVENAEKGKLRVVQSGIARLQTYATSCGLHLLSKYLNENENEVVIHPNCQKQVTNELRKYHKTPKTMQRYLVYQSLLDLQYQILIGEIIVYSLLTLVQVINVTKN